MRAGCALIKLTFVKDLFFLVYVIEITKSLNGRYGENTNRRIKLQSKDRSIYLKPYPKETPAQRGEKLLLINPGVQAARISNPFLIG